MNALFGQSAAAVLALAAGAFMWLFYREYLSDSFWIVLVALAIAGTAIQQGQSELGLLVAAVGVGFWLFLKSRDREE